MIDLNTYIKESLFDNDLVTKDAVVYQPKTKKELVDCIKKELDRQGPDANLNGIDTSKIFDMNDLFYEFPDIRNIDISEWNVSNVKYMNSTFARCKFFNCDLSKWDVGNVIDMSGMFEECESFNCDLSKWDVSLVESMLCMFDGCKNFNCNLSKWDVGNVKDMRYMFNKCRKLKKLPFWFNP